jgi:hypothetical protein
MGVICLFVDLISKKSIRSIFICYSAYIYLIVQAIALLRLI